MKFVSLVAFFVILFVIGNAHAQSGDEKDNWLAISIQSNRPFISANLTEFQDFGIGILYSIGSWGMQRIDTIDAFAITQHGLQDNNIQIAFQFTTRNPARNDKAVLASKINAKRDYLIMALQFALSSTGYAVSNVSAEVLKIPKTCLTTEAPFTFVGYKCGSAYDSQCANLLCLPSFNCNTDSDCISDKCHPITKTCRAIPMPTR